MKHFHLQGLLALLALIACAQAMAQDTVFLTEDPAGRPMLVAEPGPSATLRFQSLDYTNPTQEGEPFVIRFGLDFKGHFNPTPSSPSLETYDSILFSSQSNSNCPVTGGGTVPCQQVKIILSGGPHPADGYKYEVRMGSQVLDPRIRPR